jgi:hypothetical protein
MERTLGSLNHKHTAKWVLTYGTRGNTVYGTFDTTLCARVFFFASLPCVRSTFMAVQNVSE